MSSSYLSHVVEEHIYFSAFSSTLCRRSSNLALKEFKLSDIYQRHFHISRSALRKSLSIGVVWYRLFSALALSKGGTRGTKKHPVSQQSLRCQAQFAGCCVTTELRLASACWCPIFAKTAIARYPSVHNPAIVRQRSCISIGDSKR